MSSACALCGTSPAVYRCSRCRAVVYCTPLHQREHWPSHKTACGASSAKPAQSPSPPSAPSVAAAPSPSPVVRQSEDNMSRAVSLVHGLRKALAADTARRPQYLKQGAMATILAPGGFHRALYPGSAHDVSGTASTSPQTLDAFLSSKEPADIDLIQASGAPPACHPHSTIVAFNALQEAAIKAVERSTAILAGVRRRGAAEGDELTAAMEATLWPQVCC